MKDKPITYTELQKVIRRVYQSQLRVKGTSKKVNFQELVRMMFKLNHIDFNNGKGKNWYRAMMIEFASHGGSNSHKKNKENTN